MVKKVMEEEGKKPLAWWRGHKAQFLCVGLVSQQILGIVNFQIEMGRTLIL
jgi:hypothetical protein